MQKKVAIKESKAVGGMPEPPSVTVAIGKYGVLMRHKLIQEGSKI